MENLTVRAPPYAIASSCFRIMNGPCRVHSQINPRALSAKHAQIENLTVRTPLTETLSLR